MICKNLVLKQKKLTETKSQSYFIFLSQLSTFFPRVGSCPQAHSRAHCWLPSPIIPSLGPWAPAEGLGRAQPCWPESPHCPSPGLSPLGDVGSDQVHLPLTPVLLLFQSQSQLYLANQKYFGIVLLVMELFLTFLSTTEIG